MAGHSHTRGERSREACMGWGRLITTGTGWRKSADQRGGGGGLEVVRVASSGQIWTKMLGNWFWLVLILWFHAARGVRSFFLPGYPPIPDHRRKIRLIESNAICRYLKNWPVKGLCGRCFICPKPPPLLRPHTPPPLSHCILVYSILIHGGKGGGGES